MSREHKVSMCRKCNHPLCNPFSMLRAGVMVIVQINDHILLGLDRKKDNPEFSGHLGGCSGHLEDIDDRCHIACACRELKEEFKLVLTPQQFIDGLVHVEMFERIPVYVYRDDSIDFAILREKVKKDCETLPKTSAYAEISNIFLRNLRYFADKKSKNKIIPITRNTVNAIFNTTYYRYDRILIYAKK